MKICRNQNEKATLNSSQRIGIVMKNVVARSMKRRCQLSARRQRKYIEELKLRHFNLSLRKL